MSDARQDATPPAVWTEPRPLAPGEFELFQALVYREAGIFLGPSKRALLVGRLAKRLRELHLDTFRQYYEHVVSGEGEELATMLDCICTNETHFFREPDHFAFIANRLVPALREAARAGAPKRLRAWSAACSTGEEPYSLAMLLLDLLPPGDGWSLEILATDLSRKALAKAEAGIWPIDRAEEIPESYRKRFMLKGTRSQEGRMKAGDEVRRILRFARLNLNAEAYGGIGSFDLVLCRNVLIYFDAGSRSRVVHRLMSHLEPGGHLFLGHAETLTGITDRLESVMPTVYTWRRARARVAEAR